MSVDQLYANGRVAVMSTRLLGFDKLSRLAESNTLSEAVKLLAEAGYGGGVIPDNPNDYEQLLVAELDVALKTLKELCANKHAVRFFLAKYDYLNAKALMKCKYMRADGLKYCYREATLDPELMQQAFIADDYSLCTENMAEACDKIDSEFSEGRRSPSIVDVTLDKAMFEDMRVYAKKCKFKYRFINDMFLYDVDTINLMTVYRARKAGIDKSVFADMIIDCGTICRDVLLSLFDDESKASDLSYDYKRFCATINDNVGFAVAETDKKARMFKFLHDNVDLLTIQPVLEYFFSKVNEIDKCRRILSAVKNGVDKDKIKDIAKNV